MKTPLLARIFDELRHIDAAEWKDAFVAGVEFLVVMEYEVHELLAVDETEVRFALLKVATLGRVGAEGEEEAIFSLGEFPEEGGDIFVGDGAVAALDLDLDDRRLDAEVVFVGDDIDAGLVRTSQPGLVAHTFEEVFDEALHRQALEFLRQALEDEVAGCFLDVGGDVWNSEIFGNGRDNRLTFQRSAKLIGVGLHLEQAHGAADFVEGTLGENRALQDFQPFHFANIRVARFQLRVVFVVTDHLTDMDLAVCLVWKNDQIANLHFMDESEKLPGVVRNGTGLLVGIDLRHRRLIGIAVRIKLGKVAHGMPAKGDAVLG